MSAARVAKLEDLLGRIQANRRPQPGPIALGGAALATAPVAPEPAVEAPSPERPSTPAPAPFVEETTAERVAPPPKPTPMEMALEVELESRPEAEVEVEITVDEGPEITIDEEGELTAETAPIGTPAPTAPEPLAPEPLAPRPIAVPAARPSAPVARAISAHPALEPTTFGDLLGRALALRPR